MLRGMVCCLVLIVPFTSAWPAEPRINQSERRDRMFPELVVESHGRRGTCDALTFTRDGKHLVAVGDDKVVRVWESRNGQIDPRSMKKLRWSGSGPLRGAIYALAVPSDPKDRRVAIGGVGMKAAAAAVIDCQSEQILSTTYPIDSLTIARQKKGIPSVRAITFAPDGKRVALGTADGSVWLWHLEEKGKKELQRLGQHLSKAEELNRVRFLHFPNNRELLSVAQNGNVIQWNFTGDRFQFQRLHLFDDLDRPIHDVCLSPDGEWLAARATKGAHIYIRSFDGQQKDIHPKGYDLVSGLAFDPSGKRLAVGLRSRAQKRLDEPKYDLWENDRVVVYDVSKGKPAFHTELPHVGSVDVLTFHPNGAQLAVAGGDNHEVTLWSLGQQPKQLAVLRGVGRGIWNVALSKDDRYLAFQTKRDPAARDPNKRGRGSWAVFDLTKQVWAAAPDRFQPAPKRDEMEGWQVKPVGTFAWKIQNPDKGISWNLPWNPNLQGIPQCYTFLPRANGQPVRLAVGHYHGVSVFELSDEGVKRVWLGMGHEGEVMSLAVSAKGDWLVSASNDQTIAAWSLDQARGSELGARFDRDKDDRVVVADVELFSPAWEAGLLKKDRVVQLTVSRKVIYRQAATDGTQESIGSAEDCLKALEAPEPDKPLIFSIQRGGNKPFDQSTNLSRRPLWRFFPTQEREWVLWMWGHAYYACSNNGDRFIGWQINNADLKKTPAFYEAEKFRQLFHKKRVINKLLDFRGKRLDARDRIRQALKENEEENSLRPPKFEHFDTVTVQIEPRVQTINRDKDVEVKLTIEPLIKDPDYAPARAELWINDHRLYVWEKLDGKALRTNFTIKSNKLRQGDNELTLQCYNKVEGRGQGRLEASGRIRCNRVALKRNLHGLLVGFNDYSRSVSFEPGKPLHNLNTPIRDMEAIRAAWMSQQKGKLYDKVDIALLTEKNCKEYRPTILKHFQELAEKVGPDDQVFVFLAGHGLGMEDRQRKGNFWFCCPDFDPAKPRTTSISARKLYELLADIPCRKVLFLDVCHSGEVVQPLRDLTPGGRGPTILASCDSNQRSWEPRLVNRADAPNPPSGSSKSGEDGKSRPGKGEIEQNSFFVAALLEAFQRADRDGNGLIDAREIYDYTKERVPALLKEAKVGSSQNPTCFPDSDALERNVLLVRSVPTTK